jgi:hypothetical protein
MPRHQYNCLDEAADEIRLATILPGIRGTRVLIELHTTCLGQGTPTPSFEALSYAWGSVHDTVEIQVGKANDSVLAVTKNLESALQRLRSPDRPRVFWIDAICVDQENLQERGHQVRRMADIYTRAERVVVWLGPEAQHTTLAMKTLATLSTKVRADWSLWITTPEEGVPGVDHHWARPDEPLPYDLDTVAGIAEVYGRDWFQRLWVQQEIRLANDRALVMCGSDSMLFTQLRKAALCLFNKTVLDSKISRERLSQIWAMGNLGYTNLPGIISFTRPCHCSDPKDRIFAILSFLQKYEKDLVITPDYRKTVQDLYQEVTWAWIQHNSALDILTLCDGTSVAAGLPSWVPNFAVPPKSYLLQTISTASARTSCTASCSGGRLTLEGVHLATITEICPWQENEAITDTIRRLAPPNVKTSLPTNEDESPLDEFCSTLNGGLFSRNYIPDDTNSPNYQKFKALVLRILDPHFAAFPLSKSERTELNNAEKYIRGRSFYQTDNGRMGLAPLTAQAGDQVVILLGGRSAFVLRPASGTSTRYQMVGEAYVHGLMYGEALLGPLPPKVQSIARYDGPTDSYWRCYLDTRTGMCEVEDPRLGPLPHGWRRRGHDKAHVISWYVNDITGEGFGQEMRDNGFVDPRLQPDALRARGVQLQTYDLV